jgi:hypothetical protein
MYIESVLVLTESDLTPEKKQVRYNDVFGVLDEMDLSWFKSPTGQGEWTGETLSLFTRIEYREPGKIVVLRNTTDRFIQNFSRTSQRKAEYDYLSA